MNVSLDFMFFSIGWKSSETINVELFKFNVRYFFKLIDFDDKKMFVRQSTHRKSAFNLICTSNSAFITFCNYICCKKLLLPLAKEVNSFLAKCFQKLFFHFSRFLTCSKYLGGNPIKIVSQKVCF